MNVSALIGIWLAVFLNADWTEIEKQAREHPLIPESWLKQKILGTGEPNAEQVWNLVEERLHDTSSTTPKKEEA